MLEGEVFYVAKFWKGQFVSLVAGPYVEKEDADAWLIYNHKDFVERVEVVKQQIMLKRIN